MGSVAAMATTTISVPEIHCDHCKMSIEGAVGSLEGVDSAEVSVPERNVTVAYDDTALSLDEIKAAIVEQGYELAE